MSTLSQFFGANVKSIQTGYVSTTSISSGSGQDTKYVDVTISSVNTAKCLLLFDGGFGLSLDATQQRFAGWLATPRLTSATNLRLALNYNGSPTNLAGQWQVVEFY